MFTFKQFVSVYEDVVDPNLQKSQQLGQQLAILDQKRARLLIMKAQVDKLLAAKTQQNQQQANTQQAQMAQNTAQQATAQAAAAPAQPPAPGTMPQ